MNSFNKLIFETLKCGIFFALRTKLLNTILAIKNLLYYVENGDKRYASSVYVISDELCWSLLAPRTSLYAECRRNASLHCYRCRDCHNHVTRCVLAGKLCGQALLKVIYLSSHPLLLHVPIPTDSTSFRNLLMSALIIGNANAVITVPPRTKDSGLLL